MESPLLWLRADPEMEYLAEIHFHQPVQMWVRLNFVIHNIFVGRVHVCLYFISGLLISFFGILGGQSLGFSLVLEDYFVVCCCFIIIIVIIISSFLWIWEKKYFKAVFWWELLLVLFISLFSFNRL